MNDPLQLRRKVAIANIDNILPGAIDSMEDMFRYMFENDRTFRSYYATPVLATILVLRIICGKDDTFLCRDERDRELLQGIANNMIIQPKRFNREKFQNEFRSAVDAAKKKPQTKGHDK